MNLTPQAGGHAPQASSSAHHDEQAAGNRPTLAGWKIASCICLIVLMLSGVGLATIARSPKAVAAPKSTTTHHIVNGSWYLHPGNITDTPTISSPVSDLMATGTTFEVQCAKAGDAITSDGNLAANGGGDVAWEYGTNTTTGNSGFVADQGLDTQVTQGQEIAQLAAQGIPECGSDGQTPLQPAGSLQGHQAVPAQTNIYNRQAAADWAYANGMDQPPSDGSCTWFVSNALWQGGLAKTHEWTSDGHLSDGWQSDLASALGLRQDLPGTIAAWNVQDFLAYMRRTYPASSWEPIDFSPANNDPQDAQVGDLVFYNWDGDSDQGISHVAIVTKVEPSGYLDVTDWSTNENDGTLPSPVPQRGVTYSAWHHNWLQVRYPNVHAWLMHIDTSGSPGSL